jgi:hypothetical protein
MSDKKTSPSRAKTGDEPASLLPVSTDIGENSASTLIESPLQPGENKLEHHDFADGGGSGGAEAFRRKPEK